jgi:hypothetical protein
MSSKRNGLPGALLAMAGMVLLAAPQLVQSALPSGDDELDEVTVRGMPLYRMRTELVALEKRFYERYNQLNKDKDFDMHCYIEAPLGTRVKSYVCRVAYLEQAQADWAQALVSGYFAPDPQIVEFERRDEYRQVALKVINGDQLLLRLARERVALEKRYLAELRRRSKG